MAKSQKQIIKKYFPIDPVYHNLYLDTKDEYYKLKSTYVLAEEEFLRIKDGPHLHMCEECRLSYDYYERTGKTVKTNPDTGSQVSLGWKQCTGCSLSYDTKIKEFFKTEEGKKVAEDPLKKYEYILNNDPVAWFQREFGVTLTFYQKQLLRCTSKRQIWKLGRRSGKTFTIAATLLLGAYFRAKEEIEAGDKRKFTMLVICAGAAQIITLFQELVAMINGTAYENRIKAMRRSAPYSVEFDNGVVVNLFVANKGDPDKIRGQGADILILDEAAFIPEEIITRVVIPIATDNPYTRIIMSSSISGEHDFFWRWDTNKEMGWKTFHFRSIERPSLDMDNDQFLRSQQGRLRYALENDCVYCESPDTVFDANDIDDAISDYLYPIPPSQLNPEKNYSVVGVDWNDSKEHGVHIVVVAYNKSQEKFILVNKEIIKGDYHQIEAANRCLEMAKEYNARFIYADAGAGTMAIQKINAKIKENKSDYDVVVKPIFMQGKIAIRDPLTKQKVEKPAKMFLIDYLNLQFENHMVSLPTREDYIMGDEDGLIIQIRDLKVEKKVAGIPKYNNYYDHTLTAFYLAVGGISIEYSDLVKTKAKTPLVLDEENTASGKAVIKMTEFRSVYKQDKNEFFDGLPKIKDGIIKIFGEYEEEEKPEEVRTVTFGKGKAQSKYLVSKKGNHKDGSRVFWEE